MTTPKIRRERQLLLKEEITENSTFKSTFFVDRNSLQFSHQVFELKAASGHKNTSDGEFHTFVFFTGNLSFCHNSELPARFNMTDVFVDS